MPEQIRGASETGPFCGRWKQYTPNHLRVNMGTANHVDDPGGEPNQLGNGRTPEGWLPSNKQKGTARLQLYSETPNTRSPVFKINTGSQ